MLSSTTNIGTVPGQWFEEGSTKSTDVLVSYKEEEISIHFTDDTVKKYSVKDTKISDYLKGVPLKVLIRNAGIVSIPDSIVAQKIINYRYPLGARIERNMLWWFPLIIISILILAIISFFIVPSMADRIAPNIPKDVVVSIGDRVFEQVDGLFEFELTTEEHEFAQEDISYLGNKLLENYDHEFKYEFLLITNEDLINAFALRNGMIVMSYDLYKELSEEEVAAVLAHEITHVEALHGMQGLVSASTWFVISSLLLSGPAALAYIPTLAELSYSREHEFEADCLATEILVNAGYSPLAMQEALLALQDAVYGDEDDTSQDEEFYFEFVSTHPVFTDRVAHVAECAGAEANTF